MNNWNGKNFELKQIKWKDIFKNLKSDYFIRIIFNNLQKRRALEIVKYNKNIKNRINININNYKEYLEKYSPIEIEIKPIKNKKGKFITILEENKKFIHIYFNNDKEEIKRNYFEDNEQIKKIKIIIDFKVKSFKELFKDSECVESINFNKFHMNNIDTFFIIIASRRI